MSEKNETIKFKEEDLKSLKDLQTNYLSLQTQFGQLHMAKINLKKQYDDLQRIEEETQKRFEEVQKEENDLIETLTGKYGKGQLDPATGVFTPASEEKSNS
tara:strand:+ start:72 stop:374 length:303 start_codon:yes stop_codon:yes gene_type:complete